MKNIIFIAPPAAGKGTISDYLVKNYNYEHISTGDLLRAEINSGSEFGSMIDKIISEGNLVSDEIMIELMSKNLKALPKDKPFILDGFPRTLTQVQKLEDMLKNLNITNIKAIYLDISLEDALKRVLGRVICPKCGKSYNLDNEALRPIVASICDDCGTELIHRNDDTEETFKVRFASYLKNTLPILNYYEEKEILKRIDATSGLENLYHSVISEVKND